MTKWTNGERFYGLIVLALTMVGILALGGYIYLIANGKPSDGTLGSIAAGIVGGLVGIVSSPRSSQRATDPNTGLPAPEPPQAV